MSVERGDGHSVLQPYYLG